MNWKWNGNFHTSLMKLRDFLFCLVAAMLPVPINRDTKEQTNKQLTLN